MATSVEVAGETVLSLDARRRREQVFRLYENAPIGFAATLVNSSILVGILRNEVEAEKLALWWASIVVLTLARSVQLEWFRRVASKQDFAPERWAAFFVAGIFAAGVAWGSAGIFLFPSSVPHQTFVAFVLGGMVAGAAATFSVRMEAFLAYAIPALLPVVVQFLSFGDELRVAMGIMMLLFGLLLTWTAHRVNGLISHTLELNGELASVRAIAHGELGELGARLRASEERAKNFESKLGDRGEEIEERLRQCVSDMTDTFVTLLEKSERRIESRSARRIREARRETAEGFAQGISYRLYGALRNVADELRLQFRRSHPDGNGAAGIAQGVERVEAALESASSLVDELLAYAGGDEENPGSVDVGELLRVAANEWKTTLTGDASLWLSMSELPTVVRGQARALRIAVHHVLANACEAVNENGGTVEVRVRTVPAEELSDLDAVEAQALLEGTVAVIEVVDDGDGMPRDIVERIFDPFFSTKSRGRGLGMAIAAAILRRHRGLILVDSRPLRGTNVRLLLPAIDGASLQKVH